MTHQGPGVTDSLKSIIDVANDVTSCSTIWQPIYPTALLGDNPELNSVNCQPKNDVNFSSNSIYEHEYNIL